MDGINVLGGAGGFIAGEAQQKELKRQEKAHSKKLFSRKMDKQISTSKGSFSREIQTREELSAVLDEIYQLGEKLKGSPTWSQVKEYKQYIQDFLRYVVKHGFMAEEKMGILKKDLNRKQYTTVRMLDKKLENLAAGVLQDQKNQLEILAKIDEIYGLLVDLFS